MSGRRRSDPASTLGSRTLGSRTATALLGLSIVVGSAEAQRLVEWTEGQGELGLGYPVPIPVETPLPFDGFRSYAGLHARHQSLADETADLEGMVIGQTGDGRDIWAYRLGDPDAVTAEGLAEGAILIQGGIHAREWQSPEAVTGIIERFMDRRVSEGLERYLLDDLNMVLIPVLNIDGFLQTQRYPTENYLGTDPGVATWPRDGRMRRKNMNGVDEALETTDDHLFGIDLNRNNPPNWGSGNGNSPDARSLVHRGASAHSEAETRTMTAAADLGPADRLRAYTDVHSFGEVLFSVETANGRRNSIQRQLLQDFSGLQANLPGNRFYPNDPSPAFGGIGSTDEYFATTYEIPSWTLEIEPDRGGVDYGGFGNNGHDGFILPEAEIARVRDNLGLGFAVLWYHQAGPPTLLDVVVTDPATDAVILDAAWDVRADGTTRERYRRVLQPLELDRDYDLWLAFDKPMRWRDGNGDIAPLPGQSVFALDVDVALETAGQELAGEGPETAFLEQAGHAPSGHRRYVDDAVSGTLRIPSAGNEAVLGADGSVELAVAAADMVGLRLDADPSTPVDWSNGAWQGWQDANGAAGDVGGIDRSLSLDYTTQPQAAPFLVGPGVGGAWFDPTHDGEGFLVEILEDGRALVFWFTYDEVGGQRWMIGEGRLVGNVILFPELVQTRGARFGAAFDPADVERFEVGSARFVWRDCDRADMAHDVERRRQRQAVDRLIDIDGIACDGVAIRTGGSAAMSGTWFAPSRDGEGFVIQALPDGRLFVFWFTYDAAGEQAWIFGEGTLVEDDRFVVDDALITSGGRFGDEFDPDQVVRSPWGRLEFTLGCETGSVAWEADDPAFGSGGHDLVRLSILPGLACASVRREAPRGR